MGIGPLRGRTLLIFKKFQTRQNVVSSESMTSFQSLIVS